MNNTNLQCVSRSSGWLTSTTVKPPTWPCIGCSHIFIHLSLHLIYHRNRPCGAKFRAQTRQAEYRRVAPSSTPGRTAVTGTGARRMRPSEAYHASHGNDIHIRPYRLHCSWRSARDGSARRPEWDPPEGVQYYGLPFFRLSLGRHLSCAQMKEAGHPSRHRDLPLLVDEGEDCLLLACDSAGELLGWLLARFLFPVDSLMRTLHISLRSFLLFSLSGVHSLVLCVILTTLISGLSLLPSHILSWHRVTTMRVSPSHAHRVYMSRPESTMVCYSYFLSLLRVLSCSKTVAWTNCLFFGHVFWVKTEGVLEETWWDPDSCNKHKTNQNLRSK